MSRKIIQPYLYFGGRCDEALEFYRSAIGAEVEFLMRHKESPVPPPPGALQAGFEEKVMHASFLVGESRVMASDGTAEGQIFSGFSLSLSLPTEAEVRQVFQALADGGAVQMPLSQTFWSPCFGMVADRFGVAWMVSLAVEPPECDDETAN